VIGKPVVLVPSPNVADDHQTTNANALVQKHAALMVRDAVARDELVPTVLGLFKDEAKQRELEEQIKMLALADADEVIAQEVLSLIKNRI
jgi:UDP-N-acetylglucosamine--N-acetylmuramyl-(pentapeptide) pyrophosphoryl-undecaprenol N-acetylglucosamine transferase